MFQYSINLAWSDEDEGYIATIPEFPGLSAFGENPEEAVEEAKIAAKGFIEVFKEDACELPEPDKLKTHSGQTRLRMPKSLHAALSDEAKAEGVSLNTHIVNLLSERRIIRKLERKIETIEGFVKGAVFRDVTQIQTESGGLPIIVKKCDLYDEREATCH